MVELYIRALPSQYSLICLFITLVASELGRKTIKSTFPEQRGKDYDGDMAREF